METRHKKIAAAIVILVVIIAIVGLVKMRRYQPNENLYQVVLLENDQVFYGKLHGMHSKYPYLTDIYYLNPKGQQLDKEGRAVGGNQFTVIKRGIDELHQPTDVMYFSRDAIVYWENVGPDSLVARGIKADKEYRAKLPQQTTGSTPK